MMENAHFLDPVVFECISGVDATTKLVKTRFAMYSKVAATRLSTKNVKTKLISSVINASAMRIHLHYFKNKKAGQPVLKSCDWLDGQPTNKKQKFCRKYASFGDYDPARITCPLACDLKFCQNDQSFF